MDVQNAVGEGRDEGRRDDAHVARQADEIDLVPVQERDHLGVVFGAFAAGGGKGEGRQLKRLGGSKAGSVFDV